MIPPGSRVVIFGDSIVQQGYFVRDLARRWPNCKVAGLGQGGATAADSLDRFDRDVAPLQPTHVLHHFGMNDGGYRGVMPRLLAAYQVSLTDLVQRTRAIGAVPVLLSPTCVDPAASPVLTQYQQTLTHFVTACRDVAAAEGAAFIDLYTPLRQAVEARPGLIPDGVHPSPEGHRILAEIIAAS